mgnify:CR=1 FL=1
MGQVLLGALAFALAFAFDWVSWLRIQYLKPVLGVASGATFLAALAWTLATPGRYDWPAWTGYVGWPLLLVFAALLIYSLLVEIPFAATYARQGVSDILVTTGTYALVRHPGVIWFGAAVLGCILISRGRLMLVAGATWFCLDVAYAWLQERLLFPRMFAGYGAYQKTTPMLIPSWRSLVSCWRTLRSPHRPPQPIAPGTDAAGPI